MRTALVVLASLLVHAGFILAGLFYFPQTVRQFTTSQIVPLELITEIAEVTNLPEEEIEEDPVEEEAPPPEPEPEPPQPEPEIDMTAAPETEPAPEPVPVAEPVSDPEPETPPAQSTPQQPAPSREQSFDDMLRDLANTVDNDRVGSSGNRQRAASSSEAIGVTLADSIRSQAQRCYRGSADAPDPERLIVVIRVRLNRDGSLDGQPDVFNRQAIDLSGDRYWRVARDRALAAVIDCAPYRLPAEHFSIWRRIDVTFRNET